MSMPAEPSEGTRAEGAWVHRTARLLGANWMTSRSVFIARVGGIYGPPVWQAARSHLDRALPAGLAADALPVAPDTLTKAVEELSRFILDWAGHPVLPVQRTPAGADAVDIAAIAMGNPEMTAAALSIAMHVLERSGRQPPADEAWVARARQHLLAARREGAKWLKSSRKFVARAAEERGIPWRTLSAASHVLQLGEGRHARRFDASGTWRTSILSTSVAGNKRSGNHALRRAGLPAAEQVRVDDAAAVRQAVPALGLPLVLKPTALREMQGMRIVYDEGDIDDAYAHASSFGQMVVAESYIPGNEYRVLVLDGEVVSVILRLPVTVTGDGHSTIAALVEQQNQDPQRGAMDEGFPLAPIAIEALGRRYLKECGRSLEDVPTAGEVVQVHPLPMMQFGGNGREDMTQRIHPDNRALAIRAVGVFGLDVAGIDLRMPDITRSWREVGAGICEVNPQPNLAVHYGFPSPIDVAGVLIDRTYPPQDRLPMRHILIVGDEDLDAHVAAVAQALRRRFGWRVGTSGRSGVDLEGWRPGNPIKFLPEAHGTIVEDPTLDAAVYAATPGQLAFAGLGMTRVDVAMASPATPPRALRMVDAAVAAAGTKLRRLPDLPEDTARRVEILMQRITANI